MFDRCFAFPDELRVAGPAHPARVGIIGGGLAGLVAAYELQRRGVDAVVYERAERPGGRVRTHRFWDDTYADVGAMRIPGNHECVLHYVREFGLPTRPFVNLNPDGYYHLRGRRARLRQVRQLYPAFGLDATAQDGPRTLLDRVLRTAWEALGPVQQMSVLKGNWQDAALDQLMSTSLWQFARRQLSEDAWDLLGHTSGLVHYEHASLLEVLVDYFGLFHAAPVELDGGMDTLVREFVRRLTPGTLRLSTRVDAVRLSSGAAQIRGQCVGRPVEATYDAVLACVPLTTLDQITITPGLPRRQAQAVRGVTYASSTKTLVHLRRRTWELDDGIYGGGSFTDLPIQQCWYPSDNASVAPDTGIGTAPGMLSSHRLTARDAGLSHEAGVLTGAYLWGPHARRFTALPPADRDRVVMRCLEQLHPGICEDIDDIVHWDWDNQPGMSGGAFAYLAPGEHTRYLDGLATPHPVGDPRLFFAGEHLSAARAWMQGAAQSALHAVGHLLDRLSTPAGGPGKQRTERTEPTERATEDFVREGTAS
ncbi:flavin monoamine oxidase family protein [Streptomyces sp. NBC_01506]|uniref:flavin monoamine oxidase family protein n=1 Tax=Streptomyces sp. NBC_01506 TaxID=2903887 RepID=UPI003869FD98